MIEHQQADPSTQLQVSASTDKALKLQRTPTTPTYIKWNRNHVGRS